MKEAAITPVILPKNTRSCSPLTITMVNEIIANLVSG